ncbi:MAG: sigma-70 family RNA polymerase sigma factor [Verrucomicrobia bacterium]|nr:sigma-70 family RNA polymerase sigma factor [Verrucomicrobiota bacterium]
MIGNVFAQFSVVSDEQAMWRVRTHDDPDAFAQLVRRWEDPIRRLCVRMTGDSHRGEDVAQEAFARVFARRKDWEPTAKFSTWLWRIALNLCHDELRRRHRHGEEPLPDDEHDSDFAVFEPTPAERMVERERADIVRGALQRLPEHYRSVLVLRHYENLKFREIADVLGVPEGTVKSRMSEALVQITRLLKPALDDSRPAPMPSPLPTPNRLTGERLLI